MSRRTGRHHATQYGADAKDSGPVSHWQWESVEMKLSGDDDSGLTKFQLPQWTRIPNDAFKPANEGVEGDALVLIPTPMPASESE